MIASGEVRDSPWSERERDKIDWSEGEGEREREGGENLSLTTLYDDREWNTQVHWEGKESFRNSELLSLRHRERSDRQNVP